jgi:hypothetical protein
MSDKPILFSGPMVRALLNGSKTQTRRVIEPTDKPMAPGQILLMTGPRFGGTAYRFAPRYRVGDRLYVREHWRTFISLDGVAPRELWAPGCGKGAGILYIADNRGMSLTAAGERFSGDREGDISAFGKHRQAMHMPRWASRLTLTVTDVRVERLQDCSEADAFAEGVSASEYWPATMAYRDLWDSINGLGAWDENPWVAAYTFTVERGNIDAISQALSGSKE